MPLALAGSFGVVDFPEENSQCRSAASVAPLRCREYTERVRCKSCHYSLKGLTEHRCPECGQPFDPNAFASKPGIPIARITWIWVSLALPALVVFYIGSYRSFLHPLEAGERHSWQSLMAAFLALFPTALALTVMTLLYVAIVVVLDTISIIKHDDSSRQR